MLLERMRWLGAVGASVLLLAGCDSSSGSPGGGGAAGLAGSGESGSSAGGADVGGGGTNGSPIVGVDPDAGSLPGGASGSTSGGNGGDGGAGGNGGSGGEMSDAAPPELTPEEFCAAYDAALCDWRRTCRASNDCATWPNTVEAHQECMDALESLEEGFVGFDPVAAEACVAASGPMDCSEAPWAKRPIACRATFPGTVATGDACMESEAGSFVFDECSNGTCVRPSGTYPDNCEGECVAFVASGGDCTAPGSECAPGQRCIVGECSDLREAGETCTSGVHCLQGLACVGSPATCFQLKQESDSCTASYECAAPYACIDGSCAVPAAAGDPCRASAGNCPEGMHCSDTSPEQTCAEYIAAGEDCDPDLDVCVVDYTCPQGVSSPTCSQTIGGVDEPCGVYGCDDDTYCDETGTPTCVLRVPEDTDCDRDDMCEFGLWCMADGKCHVPGDVGDPCSPLSQYTCEEGLFCDRDGYVCAERRSVGELCNAALTEFSCEEGLYCSCVSADCTSETHNLEDICAAKRPVNQPCETFQECISNLCEEDLCLAPSVPVVPGNCSR